MPRHQMRALGTGPDGDTVHLWVDKAYLLVGLDTGDTRSTDWRRSGLGTEPISRPNGFAAASWWLVS
jgi:hypothetical protein